MDNIWADIFSDIREPSLQEAKKAKKDYDGDGKLESGSKEHAGVVHNEIQKKRGLKPDGQDTRGEGKDYDPMEDPEFDHDEAERTRGQSGKNKSIGGKKKTKKEEVELDEKAQKCWDTHKKVGMKMKGGKLVNDCRPKNEETEVAEEKKPLPKNRMFRKMGNLGRDIVSKNTSDDDRQKKYDRQKKITKVFNANEERELSSKKDNGEMIDVMKGKNKIEINPKLGEEIEAWVGQLLDEGYDLSDFTPDEIVEIYESVDQEDNTSVSAVKAAAARSKVKADRDRLRVSQMQQRTKTAPMESVLAFVDQRSESINERFATQYGDKTKLSQSSKRKSLGRGSSIKDGSKKTGYESPAEFRAAEKKFSKK